MTNFVDIETDQYLRDIQRDYLDFLDDESDRGIYMHLVQDMIENEKSRLIVNINDIRNKMPERVKGLMKSGFEELLCFQRALHEYVSSVNSLYAKEHDVFAIGLEGSFGSFHVSPRTLASKHLGAIVCVEGIVTKCSLVRPKILKSVHYCAATGKVIERRYTDLTSLDPFPTGSAYPTKDDEGNLLVTEYGLCKYKDYQTVSIQEMPEKAPAGQLPRSVDIVCDSDLCDTCKPGDRVQVVGAYRCLPGKRQNFTSATFRTVLIANCITQLCKDVSPVITVDDVKLCKTFCRSNQKEVFELLSNSLAPSIHGNSYIKKAILCLLLGGDEKILDNGMRLRGDINILLIGDPSVAKSQLLRYVLHSAPRAISTTGRGSSGVGLTAAVTSDQETGERRLEAGAMVLADRGIVCIDEFDKMTDVDRTAIHEVMEQGRVTISKAGIHARLNARCSVLAAANPVYGRYNQYKTPMENIGMQDSLLSRFDLLFIMLDTVDAENDRNIADHVVRMHRYRSPAEQDGDVLPLGSGVNLFTTLPGETDQDEDEDGESKTSLYEKHNTLLFGVESARNRIISMNFIKKYIHIAREMRPKLTSAACDAISQEYARLRSQDGMQTDMARTQPITPRSLETLIRLSTAHAKCRLSKTIGLQDTNVAIQLLQYAVFKRVDKKRRRVAAAKDGEFEDDDNFLSTDKRSRTDQTQASEDPYSFDQADGDTTKHLDQQCSTSADTQTQSRVSEERLKTFKELILDVLRIRSVQCLPMQDIKEHMTQKLTPSQMFSQSEIDSAVNIMMEANQIMVADDMLFLI